MRECKRRRGRGRKGEENIREKEGGRGQEDQEERGRKEKRESGRERGREERTSKYIIIHVQRKNYVTDK